MLNADLRCSHRVKCYLLSTVDLCFFISVAPCVKLGVLWKSYALPICSSMIATKIHLCCVKHFTCFSVLKISESF
jgi:hypothetical protein